MSIIRYFAVIYCSVMITILANIARAEPVLKIIEPIAVGNTADIITRIMSDYLSQLSHRNIVIENHPGANGAIALRTFQLAAPDGNTLFAGATDFLAVNPKLAEGLIPIGTIALVPVVLTTPNKYATLEDFLQEAMKGQMNYGIIGDKTVSSFAAQDLMNKYGFKAQAVPFRSTPDIVNELRAGRLDFGFTSTATVNGLEVTQFPDEKRIISFGLWASWGTPDYLIEEYKDYLSVIKKDTNFQQKILKMNATTK